MNSEVRLLKKVIVTEKTQRRPKMHVDGTPKSGGVVMEQCSPSPEGNLS